VLIVTDVTRMGEIDDTVTLHIYRRLEDLGCVKVIAVVPIFGNGGSSTVEVSENLKIRLSELGIRNWPMLAGPDHRLSYSYKKKISAGDLEKLKAIASAIGSYSTLDIVELGPFTVSAGLLLNGLVRSEQVSRVLGVGGRSKGEHFAPTKIVPFAFRDMNVAEDRQAIRYLLQNHAAKLRLVSYRTGIGARAVDPGQLAAIGAKAILPHALKRAMRMKLLGYGGKIPIWDTWTALFFLKGGEKRLGCTETPARMMYDDTGFRPSDSMQLRLLDFPDEYSRLVTVCHALATSD
jgi:hypothetical protein